MIVWLLPKSPAAGKEWRNYLSASLDTIDLVWSSSLKLRQNRYERRELETHELFEF